jgi:gas vesicle protein
MDIEQVPARISKSIAHGVEELRDRTADASAPTAARCSASSARSTATSARPRTASSTASTTPRTRSWTGSTWSSPPTAAPPGRAGCSGSSVGVAAGVLGAYLGDPDRGKSRRAQLSDQAAARTREVTEQVTTQAKVAADKARGAVVEGVTDQLPDHPESDPHLLEQRIKSEVFGHRDDTDQVVLRVDAPGTVALKGTVPSATSESELLAAVAASAGSPTCPRSWPQLTTAEPAVVHAPGLPACPTRPHLPSRSQRTHPHHHRGGSRARDHRDHHRRPPRRRGLRPRGGLLRPRRVGPDLRLLPTHRRGPDRGRLVVPGAGVGRRPGPRPRADDHRVRPAPPVVFDGTGEGIDTTERIEVAPTDGAAPRSPTTRRSRPTAPTCSTPRCRCRSGSSARPPSAGWRSGSRTEPLVSAVAGDVSTGPAARAAGRFAQPAAGFGANRSPTSFERRLVVGRRRVGHRIRARLGLRERDHLADRVLAGQQHHDAVEARRDPAVGRDAVAEPAQQEPELLLGGLVGDAEEAEDAPLQLRVVDPDDPEASSTPLSTMS